MAAAVITRRRKLKLGPLAFWVFPVSAVLLIAGDSGWKDKPIASWSEEDARQVLANSPWAKTVKAIVSRKENESQRREGGMMGQGHGVGFDGIDGKRNGPDSPAMSSRGAVPLDRPVYQALQLRWESALPIRAAELKAHVIEPPTLAGDGYSIAVYGVPGSYLEKGDPKTLGDPLKKQAVLKRAGKKDAKPSSVEVFQREDGLVVVYLFPYSAEISDKDGRIAFEAQIGRLILSQAFDAAEMRFLGKLEL